MYLAARDDYDALTEVTLEETNKGSIFASKACAILAGTPVRAPQAVVPQGPSLTMQVEQIVTEAYRIMGRDPSAMTTEFARDSDLIRRIMEERGLSAASILHAAQVGAAAVGSDTGLYGVLKAGFAADIDHDAEDTE